MGKEKVKIVSVYGLVLPLDIVLRLILVDHCLQAAFLIGKSNTSEKYKKGSEKDKMTLKLQSFLR